MQAIQRSSIVASRQAVHAPVSVQKFMTMSRLGPLYRNATVMTQNQFMVPKASIGNFRFSTSAATQKGDKDEGEISLTERIQAAIANIKRVQRKDPIKYMANDRVPIDLEGTMVLPQIPERKLVVDYLKDKHVDHEVLYQHLFSLAQDFMSGLQARDFDGLQGIAEANFVEKLRARNEQLVNKDKDWFEYEKVEYDPERVVCVDKIFYRGVGVDRSTNDDIIDYRKESAMEQSGIRQYLHKFDLGMQDFYYMNRYFDEIVKLNDEEWCQNNNAEAYKLNRVVKEGWLQMRNEMLAKQFRYLFRVTLQFKSESLGTFKWPTQQEREKRGLNADDYPNAGNHIAIFECQLKQPPMFSLNEMSHHEYFMSSRINFKNWRLVDFDNYMQGNSHFSAQKDEVDQNQRI